MVYTLFPSVFPAIRCEIKHIPHMHRPDIGTFFPHFNHMFVIECLVFLCIVSLLRLPRLIADCSIRPILGQADCRIRMRLMEAVKPSVVLFLFPHIPAIIQVVGTDIRQFHNRFIRSQNEHIGHGGQPGFIQFVAKVIQNHMVLHQIFCHASAGGDFIGQPPADDGRVIVILYNQFCHLA